MNHPWPKIVGVVLAAVVLIADWMPVTLAWAQTYITSVEIQFRDGSKYTTTQPAWAVKSISSDGVGNVSAYPFAAPATPPTTAPVYTTILKVGSNQAVKALADAIPRVVDSTAVILNRGETFDLPTGWTISKKNIGLYAADGTGELPRIVWKRGAAGSMLIHWGDGLTIDGLRFDAGPTNDVKAIELRGKNATIRRTAPTNSLSYFIFLKSATNTTVEECTDPAIPKTYWIYSSLQAAGDPFNKNLVLRNNIVTAGVHCARLQALDGLRATKCEFRGMNAVSTALKLADGSDQIVDDCDIAGTMRIGPLNGADGNPAEQIKNLNPIIRNSRLKLRNNGAMAVNEGVVNLLVEKSKIETQASYVVSVEFDSNYAARGRATGKVDNNAITGPQGVVVVKGTGLTSGGNTVNGGTQ